MSFRHGALAVLALLLGGCGSKGSVSLTGTVRQPSITVEERTLGTELTGSFELFIELGPEAPEATTVNVQSFALLAASDRAVLVDPLRLSPTDTEFSLGVGQTRTIPFELNHPDPLPADRKSAICAGDVVISGALTDTLSGGKTTPVGSSAFAPSGC